MYKIMQVLTIQKLFPARKRKQQIIERIIQPRLRLRHKVDWSILNYIYVYEMTDPDLIIQFFDDTAMNK